MRSTNTNPFKKTFASLMVLFLVTGLSGCFLLGLSSNDDVVKARLDNLCAAAATLPSSLPDATVGLFYSVGFFSPNAAFVEFIEVTAFDLPPGLALVDGGSLLARIEGTPTLAGTYTIRASTSFGCRAPDPNRLITSGGFDDKTLTLRVKAPVRPIITTNSLPSGTRLQAYSTTLQATGGAGNLTWSLLQGTLPNGLSFSTGGVISGVPDTAGTANFRVQVQDSLAATDVKDLSITIAPGAGQLAITSASLPNAAEDNNYTATVQTTGGVVPLTFFISSGALPANVTLNPATGALSGLHPAGGQHTFTVQVRDSGNPQQSASQAYTILILEVTTTTLPDGTIGQPYSQTFAAIGQVSPVTWSPAPGTTLPSGFMLSAAGILSGIPTPSGPPGAEFGPFFFSLQVTDSDTPPRTDQQSFSLLFNNPVPVIATLTPSSAAPGDPAFTLTVNGSGFVSGSEVRWNGAARLPTTFVNSSQVTADIPGADIAVAGSASVTVFNPPPVGGLSNAATFTIAVPPPPPPPGNAGVTDLVSQSSAGVPSNDDSAVTGLGGRLIAISQDGNRVVFASEGTNLDGPERGVFVRDMALGVTRRASSTITNTTTNGVVGESLSISGDGNVVAFQSRANNHVAGDTGADSDVFVVNTCIFASPPVICNPPEWISVMPDGTEPLFGVSGSPALSSNGRFVAFDSNSPLTGINTGRTQIFVRDRNTNITTMVSVDDMGNAGTGNSLFPAISGDGRFIAFVSDAFNLVSGDTNNQPDIFVHDTCFGASGLCTPGTTRVNVATGGAEATGGGQFDYFPPSINDDGRFVVFASSATNLAPNTPPGAIGVFLHDRLASPVATTTRVSLDPTGAPFFAAGNPAVSSDGRFVAFESVQVYVYDTCFGAAGCTPGSFVVSRVPGGASANAAPGQPAISGDARFVVFQSRATNLLPSIVPNIGIGHIYRARAN